MAKSRKNPKTVQRILDALRIGATYKDAANAAGISYETFRSWQQGDPAFSAAIDQAEAEMAHNALVAIQAARESGDWHAAKWLLERRRREDFGPPTTMQQQVTHDGTVTHRVVVRYEHDWRGKQSRADGDAAAAAAAASAFNAAHDAADGDDDREGATDDA